MTVQCPVCLRVLLVHTLAWHPNDPRAIEAGQKVLDAHELEAHR